MRQKSLGFALLTLFFAALLASPVSARACPANLDDLAEGEWCFFENSNPRDARAPCEGHHGTFVVPWSGGAFVEPDKYVYGGGGHADGFGRDMWFDLETRQWVTLNQCISRFDSGWVKNSAGDWVYHAPTETPASTHTYNHLFDVPPGAWPGYPAGAYGLDGASSLYPSGQTGHKMFFIWDFAGNTVSLVDGKRVVNQDKWRRLDDMPFDPGIGGMAAWNPKRKSIVAVTSYDGTIMEYKPETGWVTRGINAEWVGYTNALACGNNGKCVMTGRGGETFEIDFELPGNNLSRKKVNDTGDRSMASASSPGFDFVPEWGDFYIAWDGGQSVYTLDALTYVWRRWSGTGENPGPAVEQGTFERWHCSASNNVCLILNGEEGPLYAWKPNFPRTGPTPPCSPDNDGDRHCGADDCNDNDALVHKDAVESCNQRDDNCNNQVDEGCICEPNATRTFYSGPAATRNVGICVEGEEVCEDGFRWKKTREEQLPLSEEICATGKNENCDDQTDEPPCSERLAVTDIAAGSNLLYEVDTLAPGKNVYSDRTYTFTGVPAKYDGQLYIRTPNNDKGSIGDSFLSFNVNQGAEVCVGYDARASSPPNWLSTFPSTGDTLSTNDAPLNLYCKDFAAGPVVLGGNQAAGASGAASNYTVVLIGKGGGSPAPQTCTPNALQACSTGKPGVCATGTETCNVSGTGYGSCTQSQQPVTETCNGLDDDCDGSIDEGCQPSTGCEGEVIRDGVVNVQDLVGQVRCIIGQPLPNAFCVERPPGQFTVLGLVIVAQNIGSTCDSASTECLAEETRPCYTGTANTRNVGACSDGVETCTASGAWPGTCSGQRLPSTETCNGLDDDCDASVDEGGVCAPAPAPGGNDRTLKLFEWAEWSIENPTNTGNKFDLVATATFTHQGTGEKKTTELFYAGNGVGTGNTWRFRFTGTRTGTWAFATASGDPDLSGVTGTVTVSANPRATGFIASQGNKYALQRGAADGSVALEAYPFNVYQNLSGTLFPSSLFIAPIYELEGQPVIDAYLDDAKDLGYEIIFVAVNNSWYKFGTNAYTEHSSTDPDPKTFEVLEKILSSAWGRGMRVHLWMWGDEQRQWNTIGVGGINGVPDTRLQRYIAARLGPIPGITYSYGFDLQEWVTASQLTVTANNLKAKFAGPLILSSRGIPNQGVTVNGYSGYGHSYNTAVSNLDSDASRPHFFEERDTVGRIGAKTIPTRMMEYALAGGAGGWWGTFPNESIPSDVKAEIRNVNGFLFSRVPWLGFATTRVNNLIDGGYGLKSSAADRFIFYKTNAGSAQLNLSGMSGPQPVTALDLKSGNLLDFGSRSPGTHALSFPATSNWAVTVGNVGAT